MTKLENQIEEAAQLQAESAKSPERGLIQ